MKIFAIFANINLSKKPVWLDEFREKYDKPYQLHITLRSPCFVEDDDIPNLKEKLSNFFESTEVVNHKIQIDFNEIMKDKEERVTVMLRARCPELIAIQKKLFEYLVDYDKFVKDKYKAYGENFDPPYNHR